MEPAVRRHTPLLAVAAAAVALSASVEAFTAPQLAPLTKPATSSLAAVGLGPAMDGASPTKDKVDEEAPDSDPNAKVGIHQFDDPYDPTRVIVGEDGVPLPHISDFEPYRKDRMSNADRKADAWFTALLESPGESFLGPIAAGHRERLLTPVELADEPVLKYQVDEEWTPYVSRRLPTSPLYPAYGLETYGLPVLRGGAEAWRQFNVNGLIGMDYSARPEGIGTDHELGEGEGSRVIAALRAKGAWLDDEQCSARLVYINGRFCPDLSLQTDTAKNLDAAAFEAGLPKDTLDYLARLPDGHTDELAAEVPDDWKGPITSQARLSGPDHCVGKATSQFAINNQQGTAAFAALNSIKAGCVAYVEGRGVEAKPVLIVDALTPAGGSPGKNRGVTHHPRTLAVAKDESNLHLVQMCVDLADTAPDTAPCPTLVNAYTQVFVGANANLTHSFLEESGGIPTSQVELSDADARAAALPRTPRQVEAERPALRDAHLHCIDAHVTGDAGRYTASLMALGGTGRSRLVVATHLLRPAAHAAVNGFTLSGGAQRTDTRTNIHHMAQGTTSRQEQRNMVGGRSTASFRGRIRVEQSAQQTDSQQLSRTMLMSDHARILATPSLEIIADDVMCTHGATVSDLSEEELFYLRSRGLDMTMSRSLLMYAFVEGIAREMDPTIAGEFDDEKGLRSRIIARLENLVPTGQKTLVGGEFQSS